MAPSHRALISVTSASAPLFSGTHATGMFISEALHPFNVFCAAGFEVDLVSETGSYTADWLSLQPDYLSGEDLKQWEDLNGEFRKKMDNMVKAVDKYNGMEKGSIEGYGIFFASAGHAALIDYPTAKGLHKLATRIWSDGGIVSAVCHGPAIFAGIFDPDTGKPIIEGKTITGFTSEGEDVLNVTDELKTWDRPLVEEHAKTLGASYVRPRDVWADFHVTDGRIVTGTNPASARSTAEAAVEAFKKL